MCDFALGLCAEAFWARSGVRFVVGDPGNWLRSRSFEIKLARVVSSVTSIDCLTFTDQRYSHECGLVVGKRLGGSSGSLK